MGLPLVIGGAALIGAAVYALRGGPEQVPAAPASGAPPPIPQGTPPSSGGGGALGLIQTAGQLGSALGGVLGVSGLGGIAAAGAIGGVGGAAVGDFLLDFATPDASGAQQTGGQIAGATAGAAAGLVFATAGAIAAAPIAAFLPTIVMSTAAIVGIIEEEKAQAKYAEWRRRIQPHIDRAVAATLDLDTYNARPLWLAVRGVAAEARAKDKIELLGGGLTYLDGKPWTGAGSQYLLSYQTATGRTGGEYTTSQGWLVTYRFSREHPFAELRDFTFWLWERVDLRNPETGVVAEYSIRELLDGAYGIDVATGDKIADAILAALPFAAGTAGENPFRRWPTFNIPDGYGQTGWNQLRKPYPTTVIDKVQPATGGVLVDKPVGGVVLWMTSAEYSAWETKRRAEWKAYLARLEAEQEAYEDEMRSQMAGQILSGTRAGTDLIATTLPKTTLGAGTVVTALGGTSSGVVPPPPPPPPAGTSATQPPSWSTTLGGLTHISSATLSLATSPTRTT